MNRDILNMAFHEARLKVYRAGRHLEEAEFHWRGYLESDFCKLRVDLDPETGQQTFRSSAELLPPDLLLSLGDLFHNLSAALDYVVTGFFRAKSASSSRVHFPSHETRDELAQSFVPAEPARSGRKPPNSRVAELFPGLANLIVNKIQPYKGGDFSVWETRKADNIDKHNLIIPTVTLAKIAETRVEDVENNCLIVMTVEGIAPGRDDRGIHLQTDAGYKVTQEGKPTARITFAQSEKIFAGDPVFPTSRQCIELVGKVIDLIACTDLEEITTAQISF